MPIEYLKKFNLPDSCYDSLGANPSLAANYLNTFFEEAHKNMLSLLSDNKMRDMLRISSPNASILVDKTVKSNTILSQYHRKLMMYLQRGTMKCCTAGSYGPVATGKFNSNSNNIELKTSNMARYVLLEGWALDKLLKANNFRVSKKKFQDIIENYKLLNDFKNKPFNDLVDALDKYIQIDDAVKRDQLFKQVLLVFNEITSSKFRLLFRESARDYESRAIFYELESRHVTFRIGAKLLNDIRNLNSIFGIYLALTCDNLISILGLEGISKKEYASKIFEHFETCSEKAVATILSKKSCYFDDYDLSGRVLPPIFSPDITVAGSMSRILKDSYALVLGEIHVGPTIISNPMFEFNRDELVTEFADYLKSASDSTLELTAYDLIPDADFTHHLPLNFLTDAVSKVNSARATDRLILAYRTDSQYTDIPIFFPLAIGRKLIFNSVKESEWRMWSGEYFPNILKKLVDSIDPELGSRILLRQSRDVRIPNIAFPRKISIEFVQNMMIKAKNWARELGFKEKIFVRYSPEKKPFFVDLRNPFLVYELFKRAGDHDLISVTNVLPDHNDCWLQDEHGYYNSEFRYMVGPIGVPMDNFELKADTNIIQESVMGSGRTRIFFLPGLRNDVSELSSLKRAYVNDGYSVHSFIIDYGYSFEEVCGEIAKRVKSKDVVLIGLSIGALVALRVAQLISVKRVVCINAFFDRKKLLSEKGVNDKLEQISALNVYPKGVPVSIVCSRNDARVNPSNSVKLHEIEPTLSQLYFLDFGDHTISRKDWQINIKNILGDLNG